MSANFEASLTEMQARLDILESKYKAELDQLRQENHHSKQLIEEFGYKLNHCKGIVDGGNMKVDGVVARFDKLNNRVDATISALDLVAESYARSEKDKIMPPRLVQRIRMAAAEKQREWIQQAVSKEIMDGGFPFAKVLKEGVDDAIKHAFERIDKEVTEAISERFNSFGTKKAISEAIEAILSKTAEQFGYGSDDDPLKSYLVQQAKAQVSDYVAKNIMITFMDSKGGNW